MANACACGCGEYLPENSTRQYKRGHKDRDLDTVTDTGFTETDPEAGTGDSQPYSLEDAARDTPNDPEPKEQPELRPRTNIAVTAKVRRDIEGKLAFAMGLGGQFWVLADPTCGTAFVDNADNIARKLTPLVCQSPDMVKWLTKTGNFVLWIDFIMALWPVLAMVFAHHIAKTAMPDTSQNGQVRQPNMYVVQ